MAVGFSRDQWWNYIADRSHPPVASAVVEKPEYDPDHVYAWKPAENYKGWKLIARGEAEVDDKKIIEKALSIVDYVFLKPEVTFYGDIQLSGGKTIKSIFVNGSTEGTTGHKPNIKGSVYSDGKNFNIVVSDMIIDGDNKSKDCIKLTGSFGDHHFCRFDSLLLQYGNRGAYLQGANSSIISNVRASECNIGIYLTDLVNTKLSNIELWHCTDTELIFAKDGGQRCEGVEIMNLHCLLGHRGIRIKDGLNISIQNFILDGLSGRGIEVNSGVDLFFANGYIASNEATSKDNAVGVMLWSTGGNIDNVVFDNITFALNNYYGVQINRGDYDIKKIVFRNCRFYSNGTSDDGGHVFLNNFTGTEEIIFENCIFRNRGVYTIATYPAPPSGTRVIFRNCWFDETPVFGDFGSAEVIFENCRGYVTENSGTATFSGDGSTTQFKIAHGLVKAPSKVLVTPMTADATGDFYVTADDTYIYINYKTAPPSGTDNIKVSWYAEV